MFGIAVVIVGGIITFRVMNKPQESKFVTETVSRGTLIQTVQATGTVESADEIDLSFGVAGRVTRVHVDVGDRVAKGKPLAYIDSSSLHARIEDAKANKAGYEAALDKLKAGSTIEEIAVSQAAVDSARTALENVMRQEETDIGNQLRSISSTIDRQLFNTVTGIDTVEKIIDTTQYTNYIGSKNFALKNQTKNELNRVQIAVSQSQRSLIGVEATDVASAQVLISDALTVLRDVSAVLTNAYSVLIDSTTDNTFTVTILDSYKTSVQTQQQAVKASIAMLESTRSALLTSVTSYETQIAAAEKTLASNKAQLALKKAGATDEQIREQQARVDAAQASVNSLSAQLRDYVIYAPVNGVITTVTIDTGEIASSVTPAVSMVGDTELEVNVEVPEADIAKIEVGDAVRMTFDAYSRFEEVSGTVTRIDPASTTISEATYYLVNVSIDDDSIEVKSGMTADTYIQTETKENVLLIPQRAVKEDNGTLYVDLYGTDGETEWTERRDVNIGLRGDGGVVEIADGLEEGENIVTFARTESE